MAIRITRVYTRMGDKGETALVGGKRVPKDSPRIEAYGTIDELNSIVGLARAFNDEKLNVSDAYRFLDVALRQIQDELFDLGSELATPQDAVYEAMYRIGEREVKKIEQLIDECQKELEPLKSFVLPRRSAERMADQIRQSLERSVLCFVPLDQQTDRRN